MRRLFAYLLLFSITLPTLSPWGTIAYFHLNREYIAKVLCENRERPFTLCYGQCYLTKKLKQQEDSRDKERAEQARNLPLLQLFSQAGSRFEFANHALPSEQKAADRYRYPFYYSPESRLLRPPRS